MERPLESTFRHALERLFGRLPSRWREGLLLASMSLAAAASVSFAALHQDRLTKIVSERNFSRMSALEGLPDVMGSRCLGRAQERPQRAREP